MTRLPRSAPRGASGAASRGISIRHHRRHAGVGARRHAAVLFFTGKSTIFLKSGDQLLGTDTGSIDLPPGFGGFASLITFDGGTGKMTGATGQIRLRGEFDPAAGTTEGDYIGQVCTP